MGLEISATIAGDMVFCQNTHAADRVRKARPALPCWVLISCAAPSQFVFPYTLETAAAGHAVIKLEVQMPRNQTFVEADIGL
jgi:uncharacterized membrane protein